MRKFEKTASDKYVEKILKERAKFDKKFPPISASDSTFTIESQGNRDYRIYLKFQEWLSRITYKPDWIFEAKFQSEFNYSWIQLMIDTEVDTPDGKLRFGTAQRILIESSLFILNGEEFDKEFLRTLIKSEIMKVEFAIRDSWLKFNGEFLG